MIKDSKLFEVNLNNYNGSLDLLLDLAKAQKVNLEDISITKLADQFHEFITSAKNLNLEIASECLLTATWLAYLKSKLLLPESDEEEFKVLEVAEKLKLQLKKLELIRLLSDQMFKRKRLGRDVFFRGINGSIKSIYNTKYSLTLYELLKSYSSIVMTRDFQKINIPKLPVFTTEDGIKTIKKFFGKFLTWKKLDHFIPSNFKSGKNNIKTGKAGIFSGSLELAKEGNLVIKQEKLFDDIYIKEVKWRKILKKKINNIVTFNSNLTEGEREVEAIIFAAAEPLDVDTIVSKISKKVNIKKTLDKLQQIYAPRGFNLICISNKWSFRTSANLSNLMSSQTTVTKKLSRAAIETLSIIVYNQPVTRAEIEEIRGVAFGTNTLDILMELDWVKPNGRKDVPGQPIQYATTDEFLSHFSLQKLSDLPTIDELSSAGLIDNTNINESIFGTGKFYKEKQEVKKENIYSNIDEMLSSTLKNDDD